MAILLLGLAATPQAPALPLGGNDAGSGRDAPDNPDPSFLLAPDVLHEGANPPPDAYDVYGFETRVGDDLAAVLVGGAGCFALQLLDPRGIPVDATCVVSDVPHLAFEISQDGVWFLRVARTGVLYQVGYGLDGRAPVAFGSGVARAGADPTCGEGDPVTRTFGDGASGLVFAALKTGTRAVVAWTTPAREAASLSWNVSGGATRVLVEATARTSHVFILDDLPRGESLCFSAPAIGAHALSLRNAMYAHDGDAYVINLLVLANEQPDVGDLETGLDGFAWRLRDATDGHVKAGRLVTLYGDLDHHNSGWATCYVANPPVDPPACQRLVDVIFTADAFPAGAASTYLDGIQDADAAVWMNSYWQAGTVNLGDNVGAVLTHEMGHYAFGALDLYVGSGCDVFEKSLSVMSSARNLTEFDDEVNRCPNEAEVTDYVPTWTLMRDRFPLVPDRAGLIDAGPTTPGDAYARPAFQLLPQATLPVEGTQDDAGSGRDAPGGRDPSFKILPDVTYLGTAPGVDVDHYAFDAVAGQRVAFRVVGSPGVCVMRFLMPDGTDAGRTCTVELDGTYEYATPITQTGVWYARIDTAQAYQFEMQLT